MNLAIYYHNPLNETAGGVGRVATWLARRLVAAGHRVWCFCPGNGVSCDAVQSIALPSGSISKQRAFLKSKFQELGISVVFNQCGIYKYSRAVLGCGVKVITTHHSATDRYLFCGRIPYGTSLFHKVLGIIAKVSSPLSVRVYDVIMRRKLSTIIKGSDVFTCLAPSYKDWMVKHFPRYAEKFHVIPNPIPFEHEDVSDGCKTVLFVGRVDVDKRVDRLIDAWSRLPKRFGDWKLIIVGDGCEFANVKRMSDEKHLTNIEFTGQADVKGYYSHASIICLTSDVEGVPMVLREAMSYGIAPIVFDSFSAAKEMITDHINGRLVPAFDIEAYTRALCELMDGEAERMRADIIESAKPYSGENIFALWKKLI